VTSSARDLRYGRRGGRWAETGTGNLSADVSKALKLWRADGGVMPDRSNLFHPDTIARSRAHTETPTCPANDPKEPEPCTCQPDPADLTSVWHGRYRMARARRAAGQPLDDLDIEAIARHEPADT